MKTFTLLLAIFAAISANATPTPETARACAEEMVARQVGNASPIAGCALSLATKLRLLSRMAHDGSRTEANLAVEITDGFTSCYPAVPGASAAAGRFISTIGEINDVNSTTFGGSSCLNDMWGDIDDVLDRNAPGGRQTGDPHMTTLDGLHYNFQGEGIFTSLVNQKKDLEVQGLFKKIVPLNGAKTVATHAEAFALKFGKNIINVTASAPFLYINGVAQNFVDPITLNDGLTISKKFNRFEIRSPQGDQVAVVNQGKFVDAYFKLSPFRVGTILGGLLGDFDTNKNNDLTAKNGAMIKVEDIVGNPKIYSEFGNSYRVEGKESLFCEAILAQYPSFDKDFPLSATPNVATEVEVDAAKKTCAKNGIVQEPFLQNCLDDILASKSDGFVASAVNAQAIQNNPLLIFRKNDFGSGFNGSYEIDFKLIKPNGETTVDVLNLTTRLDDSAVEFRVNNQPKYRVVTDYVNNKIVSVNFKNNQKTGLRRNSSAFLNWETLIPLVWTSTTVQKEVLGYACTVYNFSGPYLKGTACIAETLKHNHIMPIKYLLGFLRGENFPKPSFPYYIFGYNELGLVLEAQTEDTNGVRIMNLKNISKSPDLKMLDLSDVLIKD